MDGGDGGFWREEDRGIVRGTKGGGGGGMFAFFVGVRWHLGEICFDGRLCSDVHWCADLATQRKPG